ncbi:MAG: c-type cytochrome biogenesis protein CcsB [Myxococcales bacterium]|nr:MAG: c-type cytochrome biogenesis protein CcsB [Myxococcales bacterium]
MTKLQFETLSNQTVAVCGVFYFLAFLAYLVQWSALRKVSAPVAVSVGGGEPVAEEPSASDRPAFFGRLGVSFTIVAAVIHLVACVSRGLAADPVRVPWGNMYEFTLTATFLVSTVFLLLQGRWKLDWLGPVVVAFVFVVLMADVLFLYDPVVSLQDSLQSPWLVIHVIAAVTATAAFTLGGMCSVLFLIKTRWPDTRPGGFLDRVPDLPTLDRVAYRLHAFGFPVWTFAALITGPIWAQNAWGRYWGWDPKEVWAFITWVVYAAYLHARATAGWKGKAAAIVALIGLATLWFNFIGINFFFGSGSMHSYA